MNKLKKFEFLGTRLVQALPIFYRIGNFFIGLSDSIALRRSERKNAPFAIVYQQGRVGSTSVYEALSKHQDQYTVFHLHTLSLDRATRLIEERRLSNVRVDRNIYLSRKVALSIERGRIKKYKPPNHKIVTIVREPIGLMLSLIFMHGGKILPEIIMNEESSYCDNALRYFKEVLERDDPAQWKINRWFEEVLPHEIGMDILSVRPLDGKSFWIFRNDRFDVCVLKFESLTESFGGAMNEFLELKVDHARLENVNIHRDRKYDALHRYVKDNLELSSNFCRRAYSTPTMQHFYSESEREALIERWSSSRGS